MLETEKPIEIQKFEEKLIQEKNINTIINEEEMSIDDGDYQMNERSYNNLNSKNEEVQNFDSVYEVYSNNELIKMFSQITKEKINKLINAIMSKILKPKEDLIQNKNTILDDLVIKFPKYASKN